MKWNYGDTVQAALTVGTGKPVLKPCAIVGITVVENVPQSQALGYALGTTHYTVEFSDGTDALIPEHALLPLA
jgi:hypothetical protein